MDERIKKLAYNLVNYSVKVKEGEKVFVHYTGFDTVNLARAIIKEVYKAKGTPIVKYTDNRVLREILLHCNEEQLKLMSEADCMLMDNADCYIGVRGADNIAELSDIPADKMKMYEKIYSTPVHSDRRVAHTKWVVLRYPNPSMAQLSDMSLEAFEDYYFNVCNLDYSKMSQAMDSLAELMNKTDKVRIKGPGTDIEFSIKGIPAIKCAGEMNIPDGEVYTAPVKESVNGVISYNTPSVYQGFTYENVCLEFRDGRIIKASSNNDGRINEVFNTDEGARYVGEFAIGVNPYVVKPMKDILFDEKIRGSIHFTPGASYDDAPNGNKSSIHWDLVLIQTEEYGGGEIYFDDVLIRKDGVFVIDELKKLNPENLS